VIEGDFMNNRIKELRKARKETGIQLAELLNITPTYFYEIEKGKKRLSAEMALKLAMHFNVSTDYVIGMDEKEAAQKELNVPLWATQKDKRDFKRMLEEGEPVTFDGILIEGEDKEKLKRVMEAMFWDSKAKQKKGKSHKDSSDKN
jgi:HTH-type transcriptional regulator, competence development regulator